MTKQTTTPGKLLIFSGPAGAGKTTVLREVIRRSSRPLEVSVSATTRPPRPGEVDGRDYHFLSAQQFAEKRDAGEFLESFEVFGRGHWYGTLCSEVTPSLEKGKWVLLEIDVDGMLAVRRQFPDAVTFFVRPASAEKLAERLRKRGTESDEQIARRLEVAQREWSLADQYDYQIVNEDVEIAVGEICDILEHLGAKQTHDA